MRQLLTVTAFIFAIGVFSVLWGSDQAHATHISTWNPDPGPAGMPVHVRNIMTSQCGHTGQSPAFGSWMSIAGNPTQLAITVPYGTTSIDLEYHFAGVICYSNSAVPESRSQTFNASADAPGALPPGPVALLSPTNQIALNWGGDFRTIGAYRKGSLNFRYFPAGGFTTSGVYEITTDNKLINRFTTGQYLCIASGASVGGWNFASCPTTSPVFDIFVTVTPPPPTGNISCTVTGATTINVNYNYTNLPAGAIFRNGTGIRFLPPGNGNGVINDSGLAPNTNYTYTITNGQFPGAPVLDSATCRTSGTYDYDPDLSGSGPAFVGDARAGESFTVRSRVFNNGPAAGRFYDQRIQVPAANRAAAGRNIDIIGGTAGGVNSNTTVKSRFWNNVASLAAGGVATRDANYQVRNAPFHNEQVCFEGRVEQNAAGNGAPAFSTTDTIDTTLDVNDPNGSNGDPQDRVYTQCLTTYNQRFNLDTPNVVPRSSFAFPGTPITWDVTVINRGSPPDNATLGPVGRTVAINVTGSRNASGGGSFNVNAGTPANGSASGAISITPDNGITPGDDVCVRVAFTPTSGYSDADRSRDAGSFSQEYCLTVAERPFFTVENHDIWAGAVWDAGGACTTAANPEGEIENARATFGATTVGGFGEYAGYAIEQIMGFGTQNVASGTGLTFANDNAPTSFGEILGAGATSPPRCLNDYFGELFDGSSLTGASIDSIGGGGDETRHYSGDQTLNANVTIQARKTVVIDGDLYIRNNIEYGNFTYNPGSMSITGGPSLAFIVKGNIYIDQSVEELNGLYIAQPDGGSGGIIDTCSSGLGSPVIFLATDVCDEQLTINGAVVAEHILMRRTHGGVLREFDGSVTGGAEQFNFNPMMYLHQPILDPIGGATGRDFPLLQLKDLPPVF